MELHGLGALAQVTGSCFLLSHKGRGILLDIGLQQGNVARSYLYNSSIPSRLKRLMKSVKIEKIEYCFITHAHTDHAAGAPMLREINFNGDVVVSAPTREL